MVCWTLCQEVRVRDLVESMCYVLGQFYSTLSASLPPGIKEGTSKLSGKPDEMLGVTLRWTSKPSGGKVVILQTGVIFLQERSNALSLVSNLRVFETLK